MSKKFKKFFAGLLAFVLVFAMTAVAAPRAEVKAADEYLLYLAIGAGNDWELCYDNADLNGAGEFTAANGIIATQEMISVGETATVSLVMPSEVAKTWYLAPVLVAEGIKHLDYTVNSITIDGAEVLDTVNLNARADGNWWYEGTGPYTAEQSIRLAGGYNEWGDKFMAEGPTGWTELSFTITLNAIGTEEKAPEYETFLAVGAGNDWGMCWANEADNASGIAANVEKVSVGETVTLSLTMPNEVDKTWYLAPVLVAEGIQQLDYTVTSITIDGAEVLDTVNLDARADGNWWYEGTGPYTETQSIRLAGGYNEWGDKFMAESPVGWTELTYTYTLNSLSTEAPANVNVVELPEEMDIFIAIGAENVSGAWDLCWANEADNASGIEGTVEKISVGETVTLKLVMPSEVTKTWYFAPTMVVSGVGALDATVSSMKFDGEEFIGEVDFNVNPDKALWWYEGTGNYTAEETIRLAGGYNEWAEKYLANVPTGWTEMEVTVTLNSIAPVAPTVSNEIVYDGEFNMFLAGDAESVADQWNMSWSGNTGTEGIVGDFVTAKAGDTVTVGVTYPETIVHTWWLSPVISLPEAEDGQDKYLVDYTIDKVVRDGVDITDKIDLTAGEKASWYESAGSWPVTRTIRLAGGYNEWGDQFIAGTELENFTSIEYTITINKIYGVVVEEVEGPKADLDGTYNAYIGVQTADSWAFRNAWDDATYGKDSAENPDAFNQISIADATLGLVKKDGVITDTVLAGNGTYSVSLKDFDFTSADGAVAATALNLLFVSTDIPNSGEIVLSNIKVDFDGKNVMEFAEGFTDPDSKDWYKVLFINIWNTELKAAYNMEGMIPTKDITITFDVTGFNYDKAADAEPTPEVTPEPTEAPAEPTVAPTEAPAEPTVAPTEAPAEPTAAPTEAPADVDADAEGGMSPVVIVVIVVAVIAVAAGAAFVVMKKKNK